MTRGPVVVVWELKEDTVGGVEEGGVEYAPWSESDVLKESEVFCNSSNGS